MNKICTSIEQSKKLIELGIDVYTADMFYQYVLPKSDKIKHIPEIGNPEKALEWYNKGYTHFGKEPLSLKEYCIPAWSLSALLELIPPGNILLRDALSGKYKCINTVDSNLYDNPVNAAFDMVCWLKENKKI